MHHLRALLLLGIAAMTLAGCDQAIQPADLGPTIVIEGYLYANHPIDSIVVSRSLPIDAYFTDSAARVSGATVTITVDGRTYPLHESATQPGSYLLAADSLIVRSRKQYDLRVVALGQTVTASTTVPDSISITSTVPDTIRYPVGEPLGSEIQLTWSASPTRASYAVSVEALDTLNYQGDTTTVPNVRIKHPYGGRGFRRRQVTSYALQISSPQTPVPWVLYNWFGKQRLTVFAMDTNFFDFMRMIALSGNTYNSALNHIQGGIGVFGSAGIDQRDLFLKE